MKKNFNFVGMILFLACVGFSSVVSVLIYQKLIQETDKTWLIWLFIFLNIVTISVIYYIIDFTRRKLTIEKPLKSILKATEQISKGNFDIDLSPQFAFGRKSELDKIILNVNKMAKELSRNEIQKSDFIANFSHEIKTPISSINNYVTLLSDETISEEKKNEYIKSLSFAVERLSTLTNNILKMNKLENGKYQNSPELLHLDVVLSDSILTFEQRLDEKEIELDCDIDQVMLMIDETFFETISGNLISNAIKFSNKGGRIDISLKENEEFVSLKVKDYGTGMTKETGEHIFEKFYQGDTSHKSEGNGLGLAMVKKVIDIVGGKIDVSSEIGKGSTFTVNFKK